MSSTGLTMNKFTSQKGISLNSAARGIAQLKMVATAGVLLLAMAPAMAQTAAPPEEASSVNTLEEIVITARKREESVMQSPVVVQVITEQQVQDLHLTSVESLETAVPELKITPAFGLSGASVTLRGIGNGDEATYEDQSVSLSLDDFTFSDGMMYKQGLFDLTQVEVLKGPQSLFYGKSSSGGVIALHSADPTSDWEAQAQTSYEFYADERDFNAFISGPINDELGIRLAGYYDTSEGYLYNPNPLNPEHRVPAEDSNGLRGTIKFDDPDLGLRVKLKVGGVAVV